MPKIKRKTIKVKDSKLTEEWKEVPKQITPKSNDTNILNELKQALKLLKCEFPLNVHEHVTEEEVFKMEKHCYEWAKKFELITKKTTNIEFKLSKFGLLICYIFPTVSFERRCLAVDFFNWLFFVDDLVDKKKDLKGNPKEIKILLDKFKNILDDNPQSDIFQNSISIALWDVWARMKKITNETWRLKFRNTISLYFDACYLNAHNKQSHSIPNSIEEYIKIRRNSGAVMTSFNLIEPLLGIQLSYDLNIQNLMDYCNDHICFINDLYSLKKELVEGEVDNIIVVLQRSNQYSLREAIEYAMLHDYGRADNYKC
ncbi:Terpene synthase family, metal binding domain [Gigaspora margarita]|uniref:Terpene synthase n=1 Tax=Gigaspora margarita TaxID=4874 RepID=A0A8H3XFD9_GIGMA|nr:Terpene synthase family, metal binding domain [Gigaspora margarita]